MSAYAVLQGRLEPPDVEQLTKAFEAVDSLSRLDAINLARDAFGVIAADLSLEDARAVCGALEAVGVPADAAPHEALWPLPPRFQTRCLDCRPEYLGYTDALDQPQTVSWRSVRAIAAGFVKLEFRRTVSRPEPEPIHYQGARVRTPSSGPDEVVETRAELLLELHLDATPTRLFVPGRHADYRTLGADAGADHRDNFARLVRAVALHASEALLGRGAAALWEDPNRTTFYPSRHAFEEELVWLRYRTGLSPGQ